MPITKDRISSPLEAGTSILDDKHLPPQLTSALEYVSSRLARKRLHLSLIVIRKDIHIPSLPSPQAQSQNVYSGQSITASPAKSLFNTTFARSPSKASLSDSTSTVSSSSNASLSRTQWPGLPSSPRDHTALKLPPTQPSPLNPYGITLMHASTLNAKAEKILRHVIAKAEKKYSIGTGWLSSHAPTEEVLCPATNDLIRRSLAQNEFIFSSEGLTLLSLDHVYTFKCQLHTYSRTLSPSDLTKAVDELRLLVLAQQGRRISKGYLMRAYEWLGVSLAALVDVNEGYKVAYGGKERFGGIDVQNEERQSPPPLKTNFGMNELRKMKLSISLTDNSSDCGSECSEEGSALGFVEVGESAKGRDSSVKGLTEDRGPHLRGPMTPNGFEDITPVTKGEWCFLMVGEGWKEAKTAPVETC